MIQNMILLPWYIHSITDISICFYVVRVTLSSVGSVTGIVTCPEHFHYHSYHLHWCHLHPVAQASPLHSPPSHLGHVLDGVIKPIS